MDGACADKILPAADYYLYDLREKNESLETGRCLRMSLGGSPDPMR